MWSAHCVLRNLRLFNALAALICGVALGYAMYAEKVLGLEPCPLCMFQRVTVFFLGLGFLLIALHHPRPLMRYFYAVWIALAAAATVGVAGRHWYVQQLPAGSVPACGAPLDIMLQFSPLTEVIRKVLTGGGECTTVDWTFLGQSMPVWVLILGASLGVAGVWLNLRLAKKIA
jgi:protein dithiol:quinone oxidoreductase